MSAISKASKKPHQVSVHIFEARGIHTSGSSNTAHVYIQVVVGPSSNLASSSRIRNDVVNVVYNETYSFENVMLSEDEFLREKVVIRVYDKNTFVPNSLIGMCELSMENIYNQKNHQYAKKWLPLRKPETPSFEQGFIRITCHVLKAFDPSPLQGQDFVDQKLLKTNPSEEEKGEVLVDPVLSVTVHKLNVMIYRGEGLRVGPSVRLNPFVSIRFNGSTVQSKSFGNNENPFLNTRLEIPYTLPLFSNAIEIQLWNRRIGLPATIMGQHVVFFDKQVNSSRPPGWINFYSSHIPNDETTTLGKLASFLDGDAGPSRKRTESEYVGRLYVRVSSQNLRITQNPRVRVTTCMPAPDVPTARFAIQVRIYSAAHLMVKGGRVFVKASMFHESAFTSQVMGIRGTFKWMQRLRMMCHMPLDLSQAPDLILTVFLKAGKNVRPVAFVRIPAQHLATETAVRQQKFDRNYFINGEPHIPRAMPTSLIFPPQTYKLHRMTSRREGFEDTKKITMKEKESQGHLSLSIGFGLESTEPLVLVRNKPIKESNLRTAANVNRKIPIPDSIKLPKIKSKDDSKKSGLTFGSNMSKENIGTIVEPANADRLKVRLYLYQGANLPPAGPGGTLNATVVISIGSETIPSEEIKGTRFPFWFQCLESKGEAIQLETNPNLTIRVYHNKTTLIASTELDIWHLRENYHTDYPRPCTSPLLRFRLKQHVSNLSTKVKSSKVTENGEKMEDEGKDHKGKQLVFRQKSKDSEPCIVARIQIFSCDHDEPEKMPFSDSIFFKRAISIDNLSIRGIYPKAFNAGGLDRVRSSWNTVRLEVGLPPLHRLENMSNADISSSSGNFIRLTQGASVISKNTRLSFVPVPGYWIGGMPLVFTLLNKSRTIVSLTEVSLSEFLPGPLCAPNFYKSPQEARENLYIKQQKPSLTRNYINKILEELKKESNVKHVEDPLDFLTKNTRTGKEMELVDLESANVTFQSTTFGKRAFRKSKQGNGNTNKISKSSNNSGLEYSTIPLCVLTDNKKTEEDGPVLRCFVRVAQSAKSLDIQTQKNFLSYFRPLYRTSYVVRLYVYRGLNMSTHGRSRKDINSVLIVKSLTDEGEVIGEGKSKEGQNSGYYTMIQVPCQLPHGALIKVSVVDRGQLSDRLIGMATLDIEERVLRRQMEGKIETLSLRNPKYGTSQGALEVRTQIILKNKANEIVAEEIAPPARKEYQLRLVIWETAEVRYAEDRREDELVDQKIRVTSNFTATPESVIEKFTDTAWYAAEGGAEWNFRMLWNFELPCENPRVQIAMLDDQLLNDDLVGEVNYSLERLFTLAVSNNVSETHERARWLKFHHPNHLGVDIGRVRVQFTLLTKAEADDRPVGEAQNEPNRDPFLPDPKREPPPWAIYSRAVAYFANIRGRLIALAIFLVILALLGPVIYIVVVSQSVS
mmetsp:Transcript_4252/g.6336  ORF Transcript_4252/g.6336 Transcript_4252/m.6336 type:complete len:1428 (-) Transcript_4252:52-4335(-)